jgi:hypothetical protein
MPRVLSGVGEPGQPDESQSEIDVHLIVPEEFAGMSMGELHTRRGRVQRDGRKVRERVDSRLFAGIRVRRTGKGYR